jgi:signal peptidase
MNLSENPFGRDHALKCELAAETLCSFGSLRLRVTGWSMLPAIWPGDILELERVKSDELAKGEIILFHRDRRLFAHRVLKSSGSAMLTRGDALPYTDPLVAEDELLGRVAAIVRNGKCFQPRKRTSVSQRAIASLVRSSDFAARVIVRIHRLLQRKAINLRTGPEFLA